MLHINRTFCRIGFCKIISKFLYASKTTPIELYRKFLQNSRVTLNLKIERQILYVAHDLVLWYISVKCAKLFQNSFTHKLLSQQNVQQMDGCLQAP